jgi:ssDNA-binding Zn-finger/Zn-ribbon topoisomerase 1
MDHTLKMLIVIFAVCILLTPSSWAGGAGRAFPVASENLAIETFKSVNPNLEWDPTNFLIDLSGEYANCNYLNRKGRLDVDRTTPTGAPVVIYIDTIEGSKSDIDAVNIYIRDVIKRWTTDRNYRNQMMNSKLVGCSVRPACSNNAVIACIFSNDDGRKVTKRPSRNDDFDREVQFQIPKKPDVVPEPRPVVPVTPKLEPAPVTPKQEGQDLKQSSTPGSQPLTRDESLIELGEPKARAFTPEQYDVAESILGKKWDRSFFLEDLSGHETDCSMIGTASWPYDTVKKIAALKNMKITGQFGSFPNTGSTPDALKQILTKFQPDPNTRNFGCSIIPDCRGTGAGRDPMTVVITCLYQQS